MYVDIKSQYLSVFKDAACSAAAPADAEDRARCEGATVSGVVASQVRHFPADQGSKVTLSGRLPSVLSKFGGSLADWMRARPSALQMISLTILCRRWRPALLRHERP